MKTRLLLVSAILLEVSFLSAESDDRWKQVETMQSVLAEKGLNAFIQATERQGWSMPFVSSQWHVDHVSKPQDKRLDEASRQLGRSLSLALDGMAAQMQKRPADDSLYEQTKRLIALSDWCLKTDGYGNALLGFRSLDLAVVGVGRLGSNLNFPLERVSPLLEGRDDPYVISAKTMTSIINKDFGASAFPELNIMVNANSDREGLRAYFRFVRRVLREDMGDESADISKMLPAALSGRMIQLRKAILSTPSIRENESFFVDDPERELIPMTTSHLWNKKDHDFLLKLYLSNLREVKALLEFRKAIGTFPQKIVHTDAQVAANQLEKAKWAKLGLTMVDGYAVGDHSPYHTEAQAAFALEWNKYVMETYHDADSRNAVLNLDADAYRAYSEIQNGAFVDEDSAELKQVPTNAIQ